MWVILAILWAIWLIWSIIGTTREERSLRGAPVVPPLATREQVEAKLEELSHEAAKIIVEALTREEPRE